MDNNVIVLTGDQLDSIVERAIDRYSHRMKPMLSEAIARAQYGIWCSTSEACEILNISRSTLVKKRTKSNAIIWKAEGKSVAYNTASLYKYIEELGRV